METIADVWVMDLWQAGRASQRVGAVLLLTQVRVFQGSGHLLDYNQEYVRRRMVQAALKGKVFAGYVRCLRCGALAPLASWARSTALEGDERSALLEAVPGDLKPSIRHLEACDWRSALKQAAILLEIEDELEA